MRSSLTGHFQQLLDAFCDQLPPFFTCSLTSQPRKLSMKLSSFMRTSQLPPHFLQEVLKRSSGILAAVAIQLLSHVWTLTLYS